MALDNCIIMEFCRLCQSQVGKIPVDYDKELKNKILEVTKVEVNDELNTYFPMRICISCKEKILDFYNYLQIVQKVDKNLRKMVRKNYFQDSENTSNIDNSDCEAKLEDTLKCDKCPASFSDENLMNVHIKSHKIKSTKFNCPICLKSYSRLTSYNSHKRNHSQLYCVNCSKSFDEETECRDHKCDKIKIENNSDSSNQFRKGVKKTKPKFKIKTEITDFLTVHEDGDAFQCSTCNKQFNNKNSLRVHLKIHKNFTCTQKNCFKELPTAYSLKIHQLNHLGKRPFLCVTCGKGFTTKNSLTCHEKIHSDVKGYKCSLCNLGFSVRSNLRAHEKKYHEGVRFYCSQCTKEFLTKCSLDRHEKIHAGIKEFKCENCTSAFYTNKELLKHQRYHQGLKLHKCEECFKTFFERHHLIIHLRSHSGERPYVCKIPGCGKSFAESQKLKRHHTAKHNAIN